MSEPLPPYTRAFLVHETISRLNKVWIAHGLRDRGFFLEWKWRGNPLRSRLQFRFEPEGRFFEARSYDDDVRPYLKYGKEKKDHE